MSYRYLGNKTKLADWVVEVITSLVPQGSRVADPMCGTGAISEALAHNGYSVLAADVLKFPTLHANARLLFDGAADFNPAGQPSYQAAVNRLNSLSGIKGLFWVEYSAEGQPTNGSKPRRYFTGENAAKIDAIRRQILSWRRDGLKDELADLLLHDLILAVNRVANITGTYGYYRSSWNRESLKPLKLIPSQTSPFSGNKHKISHGRVQDLIGQLNTCDVCYLDPPYTKRQYGGNYHILETIAQEDEPEPVGEGGLRNWRPKASDFCYKRKAPGAFRDVLQGLTVPFVLVSYSTDGQIAPNDLLALLSEYGNVTRHETPFTRFDSNGRGGPKKPLQEHLYVLERS